MSKVTYTSDLGTNSPYVAEDQNHPNPSNLVVYLPWACGQLQCPYTVSVMKVTQTEYVSVVASAKKSAKSKPTPVYSSTDTSGMRRDEIVQSLLSEEEILKIYAVHDSLDHLVELKFDKNTEIPRMVFQILGLIIKFQKYLTTLTINQGIDKYSLHEINKFLPLCTLTDLCFDNTFLQEGNYYVLLENYTSIKRISLARCKINDNVVEAIAARLVYPLPAAKTLVILDLSSNKITDIGAQYIAKAMRSNRCLSYLNLSGNELTDTGVEFLFNTLINFQLTGEELEISRKRIMKYYKARNELAAQIFKELRITDQGNRKRSVKTQVVSKKTKILERELSTKEIKSFIDMNSGLYEKACNMAEIKMGSTKDPFDEDNLVNKSGDVYCLGNNTLCYLNLSFNNLTYISLKKLLNVVTSQKIKNRKPIGLINVCIDGNNLPTNCIEFIKVDDLLHSVNAYDKIPAKRRTNTKSSPTIR